ERGPAGADGRRQPPRREHPPARSSPSAQGSMIAGLPTTRIPVSRDIDIRRATRPAPSCDRGILTVSRSRRILTVFRSRGILTVLRRVWHAQAVVSLVGPDDYGGDQARAGEPCHLADGMDFRPGRPAGSYHRYGIGRPRQEVLAADGRVK